MRVGVRSEFSEQVELLGAVSHVDLDSARDGTSFEGEGWYKLTDTFSLGLLIGLGDDVTSFGIGGRLYFVR